jgi:cbb3-type cytochrome oxidase subunit 3
VIGAVSQETAVAVVAAAGIVLGFVVLGIVGWIFWRAAKRDRAEEEALRRRPDIADRDSPG